MKTLYKLTKWLLATPIRQYTVYLIFIIPQLSTKVFQSNYWYDYTTKCLLYICTHMSVDFCDKPNILL